MDRHVHRVAAGLLVVDGRVLLGHRHPLRRYYPDCWDAVGGHIEPGESPEQSLARECVEEIGVVVTHARLATTTRLDDLELHAFVIDGWHGTPTNLAPDELSGLRLDHPALGDLVRRVTAAT